VPQIHLRFLCISNIFFLNVAQRLFLRTRLRVPLANLGMRFIGYCLAALLTVIVVAVHGQSQLWTAIGSVPVSSISTKTTLCQPLTALAIGRNNSVYLTTDTSTGPSVYKYVGSTTWLQVAGSANSNGGYAYNLLVDPEERPLIVYNYISKPYAKVATNGAWGLLGFNGGPLAQYMSPHIESRMAVNGDVYVTGYSTSYPAYVPLVYRYSVTSLSWSQIIVEGLNGSTAVDGPWSARIALALNPVDDLPFLAYADAGMSNRATVLRRTAESWSIVGSRGFSPAAVGIYVSIDVDSSGVPYVAFADYAQSLRLTVMRYVGGAWSLVGNAGFSNDVVTSVEGQSYVQLRIAHNTAVDRVYVAYPEGASGSTTVMSFDEQTNSWNVVGNRQFSVSYANQAMRDFQIDSKGKLYVAVGATVYQEVCSPGYERLDNSSCLPCAGGYYANLSRCEPCPVGFYSGAAAASCSPCAPGTFSNGSASMQCMNCSIGTFSTFNASSCQPCGVGSVYNSSTQTCSACPQGTFSSSVGSDSCTICPAGTFSPSSGRGACRLCLPGSYAPGLGSVSCVACPSGTFSNFSGAETCYACAPGTYSSNSNSSFCTACPVGKFAFAERSTSCTNCPAGTFADTVGNSNCTICRPGFYSSLPGATTACTACSAGFWSNVTGATSCKLCLANSFNPFLGQRGCLPCPGAPAGAPSCSSTCAAGTIPNNASQCVACPPGTYAPANSYTCLPCPAGSFSLSPNTATCTLCPVGAYNPFEGSRSPCLACLTSSSTGWSQCPPPPNATVSCPFGSSFNGNSCQPCGRGFYSPGGSSACFVCPAGTFSASPNASTCTFCPVKTYNPFVGREACLNCSTANTTGLETCPPPSQNCSVVVQGPQNCSTLTAPQNATVTAVTQNASLCPVFVSCPAGRFFDGVICRSCNAGFYSVAGANNCTTCPPGSYAPQVNSSTCSLCPNGTANPLFGQAVCPPCATALSVGLTACPPVRPPLSNCTSPPSQPISCPSGTFRNDSQCQMCAAGFYAVGNASACLACPAGTFAAGTGSRNCSLCPVGSFNPLVGQMSCILCATASGTGQTTCPPVWECPAGQFLSAGTCRDCPAGFYSVMGLSSCIPCPAGTYSKQSRSTTCQFCPSNTFNPLIGRNSPQDCISCTSPSSSSISWASSGFPSVRTTAAEDRQIMTVLAHDGATSCETAYGTCPQKIGEGSSNGRQVTSGAGLANTLTSTCTSALLLFAVFLFFGADR
jgi:hypothetical protein